MFVTGLEFIPLHRDGPPISSDSEAAVLSISVDNKVCIHSLQYRRRCLHFKFSQFPCDGILYPIFSDTIPSWLAIIIIVFVLFVTFVFCSYIGI